MPLSRSRDYLSIGEVLDAVRADFPDISISKIRFLESEGLLEPERTDSGYRKFYDKDLQRLRYILTLQRDHFMPLKVIRERLDRGEALDTNGAAAPAPAPAAPVASAGGSGTPAAAPAPPPADMSEVALDRGELLKASGLSEQELADLEEFGVIARKDGGYEGADLLVAKAAKGFYALGLEARHLRMYKQIAEREIGFFEQMVTPVASRRDADATRQARDTLARLENLSRQMREGMLRASLRELL